MEAFGLRQGRSTFSTIHTKANNHADGTGYYGASTAVPDLDSAWHTYAVEWTADSLDFFIDAAHTSTFERPAGAGVQA